MLRVGGFLMGGLGGFTVAEGINRLVVTDAVLKKL